MNRTAGGHVDRVMGAIRVLRRAGPPLVRVGAAMAVLAVLVRQVGAAPFRAGLHAVTVPAVAAAVVITAGTTLCSAWRWRVVARALGAGMPMPAAIGAYYRSQFLNSILPGGIVGDVHRAVVHGRRSGDLGRGLRAVAWERGGGQVVQFVLTGAILVALPSPVRGVPLYVTIGAGVVVAGVAVLVARRVSYAGARGDRSESTHDGARAGTSRYVAVVRAVLGDVRHVLLARAAWPRVALASALVTAGHTAVFILAARSAGASVPIRELLPLALLVQAAMVIPLNAGGWGPREGVAAWAFASAGYGAATGVTITTVYAVLALAAVTPGLAVLATESVRRIRPRKAGNPGSGQTPALPRGAAHPQREPGFVRAR